MTTKRYPTHLQDVQIFSMSDELARFREEIEQQAGEPIENIEVNAALFLSDLCRFLQLGPVQHDKVIGGAAINFLRAILDSRVHLARGPHD